MSATSYTTLHAWTKPKHSEPVRCLRCGVLYAMCSSLYCTARYPRENGGETK